MITNRVKNSKVLTICVLAGGLLAAGGSAYAASPGASSAAVTAPAASVESNQPKATPGVSSPSSETDPASQVGVPAAAPEAPPAAGQSR